MNELIPKLRFNEFHLPWKCKTLSELGEFQNGLNKDSNDFGFGHPFINLMDVFGKTEIVTSNLGLVNASEKDLHTYNLLEGDVLFIRSSVKRSGVGQTVVCNHAIKNTVYSGFLIRFRTHTSFLTKEFKKYCFNTIKFRHNLLRLSTSSANTNINQESLQKLAILAPARQEQQKIAGFLTAVDTKISQLTEKHRLLKEYKKGMIQQIFSQKIRFKDEDGEVFPDWTQRRLDYFIERISEPVNVDSQTEYREIGIRSHGKGIFHKNSITGDDIGNKRVFWVKPNALVLNIVFAWERAVAVTTESEDGFIASHRFPMYVAKENRADMDYLLVFFLSPKGEALLNLASPGGAGRNKTLGQTEFAKLKVCLPRLEEQQKIAKFLESLDSKINAVAEQIEQTKLFKKGLLQQMFV